MRLSQLNIAVKWVWVKGHAEVQRNEAADSGATSGKQGNEQAIQPQAVIRAHDVQRRKQMEPMTKMKAVKVPVVTKRAAPRSANQTTRRVRRRKPPRNDTGQA